MVLDSLKKMQFEKQVCALFHSGPQLQQRPHETRISLSHLSPSPSLCLCLSRPSTSLRSSSIRNVRMTIWRPSTGTVTRQPSWVDCVAVRSRSSWSPPATRCTSVSFLTPQCKGRASKLHTPQVCVCVRLRVCVEACFSVYVCQQ